MIFVKDTYTGIYIRTKGCAVKSSTCLYYWIKSLENNSVLTDAHNWYQSIEHLATEARHIGN